MEQHDARYMQSPSFIFSAGVLHIDTPLTKMRLQWRPVPQGEEIRVGWRRWRPFVPEFRLLRPPESQTKRPAYVLEVQADVKAKEAAEQKAATFTAFREQLSPVIVRVVEPFGSHQWALMVLMDQEPWAVDLANSNPVLAYALANSDHLRGTPPEAAAVQARWYCHRKQRELLEWLGFPGAEAIVKLLHKIPSESVSPSILRCLKNAIAGDKRVLDLLSHLREVNTAVLELVTSQKYLDVVTPKLLMEVAAMADKPGETSVAEMILEGMVVLQQYAPDRNIKPFSRLEQVLRFREAVDAEYQMYLQRQERIREEARQRAEQERQRQREEIAVIQRQQRESYRKVSSRPFPPPPIPGTTDVIPLTSAEQLHSEGAEQRNCVGSYQWRVLSGDTYIYRVMAPERATLAIKKGADGCWRRSELKARKNRKVKAATARLVDKWLDGYRVSV